MTTQPQAKPVALDARGRVLLLRLEAAESAAREARARIRRLEVENAELAARLERALSAIRGGTA